MRSFFFNLFSFVLFCSSISNEKPMELCITKSSWSIFHTLHVFWFRRVKASVYRSAVCIKRWFVSFWIIGRAFFLWTVGFSTGSGVLNKAFFMRNTKKFGHNIWKFLNSFENMKTLSFFVIEKIVKSAVQIAECKIFNSVRRLMIRIVIEGNRSLKLKKKLNHKDVCWKFTFHFNEIIFSFFFPFEFNRKFENRTKTQFSDLIAATTPALSKV